MKNLTSKMGEALLRAFFQHVDKESLDRLMSWFVGRLKDNPALFNPRWLSSEGVAEWLFFKLQRRRGNAGQLAVIFETLEKMGMLPGGVHNPHIPIHLWIVDVEVDEEVGIVSVRKVVRGYRVAIEGRSPEEPGPHFFNEGSYFLKPEYRQGRDIVLPLQAFPLEIRKELFGKEIVRGNLSEDGLLVGETPDPDQKKRKKQKKDNRLRALKGPGLYWPEGYTRYQLGINPLRKGCGMIKFDKGVCEKSDRQIREAESDPRTLSQHEGDITWTHPVFKSDRMSAARNTLDEILSFMVHNCVLFFKDTIWWKGIQLPDPDSSWHSAHIRLWEEAKEDWDVGPWSGNFPGMEYLHPVPTGILRRYQLVGNFKGMWGALLDESGNSLVIGQRWLEERLKMSFDSRHTLTDRPEEEELTGHMVTQLLKNWLMNHLSDCFSATAMLQLIHHAARIGDPAVDVVEIAVPGFPDRPFATWKGNLKRADVIKTRFSGMIWRNRDPALRYKLMSRALEAADANYFWEVIWFKYKDRSLSQKDIDTLNESNFMDWADNTYREAFFRVLYDWVVEIWKEEQLRAFRTKRKSAPSNIGNMGAHRGSKYQDFLYKWDRLLYLISTSLATVRRIVEVTLIGYPPDVEDVLRLINKELIEKNLLQEILELYASIGIKLDPTSREITEVLEDAQRLLDIERKKIMSPLITTTEIAADVFARWGGKVVWKRDDSITPVTVGLMASFSLWVIGLGKFLPAYALRKSGESSGEFIGGLLKKLT